MAFTKEEIEQLRTELFEPSFNQLRAELKAEIGQLRIELRQLRAEFTRKLQDLRAELYAVRDELKAELHVIEERLTALFTMESEDIQVTNRDVGKLKRRMSLLEKRVKALEN